MTLSNNKSLFRLDNKRALVTGGSRGLGLGIATGLAEHGADIVLVARGEKRLVKAKKALEETGRRIWTFSFDLHKLKEIPEFFSRVSKKVGGVDILINNAGVNLRGSAEKVSLEDWQEIIELNLTSVFVLSQAFARERISSGKPGKIINIGSLSCEVSRPSLAAYTASKGGVRQLTKALAVEWAKYKINVNAIGPGYFATEMTKPLTENPEFDKWVKKKTPLGRWGRPEDLVGTAVFLASASSDFVTGQILYVDGGWLANL
jgi:gluconate 5-dehydrogenase